MTSNWKLYGPRATRSGLFYGIGLIFGSLLASFFFRIITLEGFSDFGEAARLLMGILLAFVIAGLAGAVGGFVGGYTLPRPDPRRKNWGYGWRSAISIGIPLGLSLYPVLLIFSLIAFFNANDPGTIGTVALMVMGVVFAIARWLLRPLLLRGLVALSKRTARVKSFTRVWKALEDTVTPVGWLFLQWIAIKLSTQLQFDNHVMVTIASLLTAWLLIRLASMLITVPSQGALT